MSDPKPCPFCGQLHEINKIATIIDYDELGNPIIGEYKDFVSMLSHGHDDFIPLDVWQSRSIEDALQAKLDMAKEGIERAANFVGNDFDDVCDADRMDGTHKILMELLQQLE